MGYEPFLIGEATGLVEAIEPWKLPVDAYSEFYNVYLSQDGSIHKRQGYKLYLETGNSDPITGFFTHYEAVANSNVLLVTDTKKLYKWTSGGLVQVTGTAYVGGASDFFTSANYLDHTYFTNNNQNFNYFDGTVQGVVDTTGDTVEVKSAAKIIISKERIVVYNTIEGATRKPQRIRWSPVGWKAGDGQWNADDYADLPTQERIFGAAPTGNKVMIFTDSTTWVQEYTGNYKTPFRFYKITGGLGARTIYGNLNYYDTIFAMDKQGLITNAGTGSKRIDERIGDFVLTLNTEYVDLISGTVNEYRRQILWLYPSVESGDPEADPPVPVTVDRGLTYNKEKGTWAIWTISGLNCIGTGLTQSFESIDEQVGAIDEWDEPFDIPEDEVGFPFVLGGDETGGVYKLNSESVDALSNTYSGDPIEFKITTGRLNPYLKQGVRARLGYIDFILTSREDLNVDFYADFEESPYLSAVIDSTNGIKNVVRVHCGGVSEFHKITVYKDSISPITIEGIIFYFKRAGAIK